MEPCNSIVILLIFQTSSPNTDVYIWRELIARFALVSVAAFFFFMGSWALFKASSLNAGVFLVKRGAQLRVAANTMRVASWHSVHVCLPKTAI